MKHIPLALLLLLFLCPVADATVNILRKQPIAQASIYTANEAFPAKRIETDLDKADMVSQMLREQVARSLKLTKQSTRSNLTVPDTVAGDILQWKADGTGLQNVNLITYPATFSSVSAVTAYTYAGLPPSPPSGTLAVVSDTLRGLYVYYGSQWFGMTFDLVNPKWFGAKCDYGKGNTDDTTALTAAITAVAAGGALRLPQGFCIASNLTITLAGNYQPVNIEGLGVGLSGIIQKSGSTGALLTVSVAAQYAVNMRWQNFSLHGNSNGYTVLILPKIYGVTLSDIMIGYGATGLKLLGTENLACWNCYIQNNNVGVDASASGGYSPNLVKFYGGQFATNTTRAVLVDHATGWKFDGTLFAGNGTAGNTSTGVIKFTAPSADASTGPYLSVRESWFEQNSGNSEIEATAVYSYATIEIASTFFLSGTPTTGMPNSVYINGGQAMITTSQMPCAGCGVGHYYSLTTTGTTESVVFLTQASFGNLDTNTLSFPYPTTGAVPVLTNATLDRVALNNGTDSANTMHFDASGHLYIEPATGRHIGSATLTTTGAAAGKTVVCVDTATGLLYASTSASACAN